MGVIIIKKSLLVILSVCFFFSLLGCTSNPTSAPPSTTPSSPKTSSYSNENIKFDYPSNWKILKNPTEDISYANFVDSNSGADPVFWYSKGEASLTDFNRTEEDYIALLSEGSSDSVIKDLTKTTIGGYEAIKLVFTYTLEDKEYTMIRYETIVGPASFGFNGTYSTETNNDYENIFESIISSVKFN